MQLQAVVALALFVLGVCGVRGFERLEGDPTLVRTRNGLVRGKVVDSFYSWEGIPYAVPAMGKLRFEPPQPYRRKWTEPFDAARSFNTCIQWDQLQPGADKLKGVEDCLVVNIYAPKCKKVEKLPVMVFIHGGSFLFGGDDFTPEYLMDTCSLILVKILYRLGPMGFLSTEDDIIEGNFGLKDQELALHWTKDNIEQFGGDANKIMLTGFSAGGASTHIHMLRPSLGNIVKVAASFSGSALNPWVITEDSRYKAFKLADHLQCPQTTTSHEIKKCLQQKKAEDIVTAVKHFQLFGYNPFTVFGPVVEHKNVTEPYLSRHPEAIMKSGDFAKIPWLASHTSEDGGGWCAGMLRINPETGKEFIYELNDRWLEMAPALLFLRNIKKDVVQLATELRDRYMGNLTFSPENYLKYQKMCTDVTFVNGIIQSMQLMSKGCGTSVYGYEYSNPADYNLGFILSGKKDFHFGTVHLDDMTLILKFSPRSPPRADEAVISKKLIQMLIDYVETGVPRYDNCSLPNNCEAKSYDSVALTLITRNKCETKRKRSAEGYSCDFLEGKREK